MQKDAQTFRRVLRAYKFPREGQEEEAYYQEELERDHQGVIEIPLGICRTLLDLLRIGKIMKDRVHKYAIPDFKVATDLAYGTMEGASFMVEANLPGSGQKTQKTYEESPEVVLKEGYELKKELDSDE